MSQNLSSPAVVIGALRVISYELIYCFVPEINYNNKNVLIFEPLIEISNNLTF